MRTIPGVQVDATVVVDAAGADGDQVRACVSTLVGEVGSVLIHGADPQDQRAVSERFGTAVRAYHPDADTDLLMAPGRAVLTTAAQVVFADGSLSRLAARAAVPDRIVTRVLVPGGIGAWTAWWSTEWAAEHGLTPLDLARADLGFDRTHLPHASPQSRAWVRGDDIGVAATENIDSDVTAWARAEGRRLARHERTVALRSRAGAVKRRWTLRRQRQRTLPQLVR